MGRAGVYGKLQGFMGRYKGVGEGTILYVKIITNSNR